MGSTPLDGSEQKLWKFKGERENISGVLRKEKRKLGREERRDLETKKDSPVVFLTLSIHLPSVR